MPLDFPSNPSDGQVYDDYYYDATIGAWQSNNGTQVPNIFKNVEYSTAQTYLTPVTVKGKLGQTANLQEWQNSAGDVLASVDESGNISVNSITTTIPIVSVPTGGIMPYAGNTAPDQFLLCNGSAVSRTTYADLFSIIGTTYGVGDNSTTFNLPNLMGRVPMGAGTGAQNGGSGTGVISGGTALTARSRGQFGGAETHQLSAAEMPQHTHSIDHDHPAFTSGNDSPDHSHSSTFTYGATHNSNGGYAIGAAVTTYWSFTVGTGGASTRHQHNIDVPAFTGTSGGAGSGNSHNNVQPFTVVNYIIKT